MCGILLGSGKFGKVANVHVRVLFFARARELAGGDGLELVLEPGATVHDVVNGIRTRLPELGDYLSTCRFAVNEEFRQLDDSVPDGASVAIIPPVSGGVGHRSQIRRKR